MTENVQVDAPPIRDIPAADRGDLAEELFANVEIPAAERGAPPGWWGAEMVNGQREQYIQELRDRGMLEDGDVPRSEVTNLFESEAEVDRRNAVREQAKEAEEKMVVFDDDQAREISEQSPEDLQRITEWEEEVNGMADAEIAAGGDRAERVRGWREDDGLDNREIAQRLLQEQVDAGRNVDRLEDNHENLRLIERSLAERKRELGKLLLQNRNFMQAELGSEYGTARHIITAEDKVAVMEGLEAVADEVAELEQVSLRLHEELTEGTISIGGDEAEWNGALETHQQNVEGRRNGEVVELRDEAEYITAEVIEEQFNVLVGAIDASLGDREGMSEQAKRQLREDLGIVERRIVNDENEVDYAIELEDDSILKRRLQAQELREVGRRVFGENMDDLNVDDGNYDSAEAAFVALEAELTGQGLSEILQAYEVLMGEGNYVAAEMKLEMAEAMGMTDRYGRLEHLMNTKFAGAKEAAAHLVKATGEMFKDKVLNRESMKKISKNVLKLLLVLLGVGLVGTVGAIYMGNNLAGAMMAGSR